MSTAENPRKSSAVVYAADAIGRAERWPWMPDDRISEAIDALAGEIEQVTREALAALDKEHSFRDSLELMAAAMDLPSERECDHDPWKFCDLCGTREDHQLHESDRG